MLTIQANNGVNDALAVKTYLRILTSNHEMKPLTELHQAAIQEYLDVPCSTPEELAERAQGLLKWDPEVDIFDSSISAQRSTCYPTPAE
jgi:hypothetical protein